MIVDQLKPRRVWLPSYLCPSILTAIDPGISSVKFFPVGERLSAISGEFLSDLRPDDLFLCIDYFGFQFDNRLLEEVKQRGCKILRDCSQALFFDFRNDQLCDFHLFSPRKFLGVPDGGILHAEHNFKLRSDHLTPFDEETFASLLQGLVLRREFDLYEVNRDWFGYFQKGESLFEPSDSAMSELSRILLRFGFEYDMIQKQRKDNYLALAKKLSHLALFPILPDEVIPLGFPVVLPDRDIVQARLFQNEIYPPVHWDIHNTVPMEFEESHKLAQQIMTLPCDQRYDENDMGFMADCLLGLLR